MELEREDMCGYVLKKDSPSCGLEHMAGYFKKQLDKASKKEMSDTIADYHRGLVPLIVPITLLRHSVRLYDVSYLAGQRYLDPHPKELMLRNHV